MNRNTQQDSEFDVFDLLTVAILNTVWYLLTAVVVAAWWAVLFPMLSLPIAVSVAAGCWWGWPIGIQIGGCFTAGIMLWRWRRPEMFERWITRPMRARFRAWWHYRQRWATLIRACRLTMPTTRGLAYPVIVEIQIGDITDRLLVRMPPGQCPGDWARQEVALAHAFGAFECRACLAGPGHVDLVFLHQDPQIDAVRLREVDGRDWGKGAAA
ncbi:hypothetical protein AB0I30_07325 [Nocardia tengchongensis]|uniref:hypothetical protein n=1 Tax=Nocardia tengchongensis TaxID=2055889 RepID=UPI0033EF1C26